jgi:hypothetical protein
VNTARFLNTIVLKRPIDITGEAGDFYLALWELQCLVNGPNLLQSSLFLRIFWLIKKQI